MQLIAWTDLDPQTLAKTTPEETPGIVGGELNQMMPKSNYRQKKKTLMNLAPT